MIENFLTLDQIAEELGISKATLYNAIENKELAATKLGRSYYVRRADLGAWIARKTVNPEARAGGDAA